MNSYQTGSIPDDPAKLPDFLRQEFLAIKQASGRAKPFLRMTPTSVAPAKYQDGDVYEAISPWNPGSGNGLYIRRAGAWVLLG